MVTTQVPILIYYYMRYFFQPIPPPAGDHVLVELPGWLPSATQLVGMGGVIYYIIIFRCNEVIRKVRCKRYRCINFAYIMHTL